MEAAVDLVVLYRIDDAAGRASSEQIDVLVRAAELTAEAMPRAADDEGPAEYWIEVNRLENQADQVYRKLLAHLFSGEYDAMTVLKLKEVVDVLEEAARRVRARGEHGRDHRGQGVLSRVDWLGLVVVVGRRPGLRLHQRLPRLGERDRHLGLHPGADPAGRAADGRR